MSVYSLSSRCLLIIVQSKAANEELETLFNRFALIPAQSPALPKKQLPDLPGSYLSDSSVEPRATSNSSYEPLLSGLPTLSTSPPSTEPLRRILSPELITQSPTTSRDSCTPYLRTPLGQATMSLAAFVAFLLSAENAPFKDSLQDMTRPLSEYYISSSHNTYLVGHQLVGESTTEGYIRALMQGCRSVERTYPYSNSTSPP